MKVEELLAIFVPSLVTILGFIISSLANKKEYTQSIQKFKSEQQISDLFGLQKDAINCAFELCRLIESPNGDFTGLRTLQEKIYSTIICFGSDDAVKLILYIRNMIYSGTDDGVGVSNRSLIAAYVILAMQLKYDTTGIKTSPKSWYVGKFTTNKMLETGFYRDSIEAVNNIVAELQLNDFLAINF